ncbi:MAG: EamA family transporter, partial [Armatimonadetes bacterium]|nr:EamA family transporter [Armatimonadota bacterium]
LLYLASLSWEDLSYVLPLTAGDYVLITVLAFFFLHEHVDVLRWVGSVLVTAGIVLVARS